MTRCGRLRGAAVRLAAMAAGVALLAVGAAASSAAPNDPQAVLSSIVRSSPGSGILSARVGVPTEHSAPRLRSVIFAIHRGSDPQYVRELWQARMVYGVFRDMSVAQGWKPPAQMCVVKVFPSRRVFDGCVRLSPSGGTVAPTPFETVEQAIRGAASAGTPSVVLARITRVPIGSGYGVMVTVRGDAGRGVGVTDGLNGRQGAPAMVEGSLIQFVDGQHRVVYLAGLSARLDGTVGWERPGG